MISFIPKEVYVKLYKMRSNECYYIRDIISVVPKETIAMLYKKVFSNIIQKGHSYIRRDLSNIIPKEI